MAHFDRHNILKDNQYGFRKKRSCETQLIVTVQEIASRLSKGDQVDVILLDFENAFDKVSHSRLLYKMDYYGVRGIAHSWIKAFLSNRKQEVVLEGHHSIQADARLGMSVTTQGGSGRQCVTGRGRNIPKYRFVSLNVYRFWET